jgi:hypothetical protein
MKTTNKYDKAIKRYIKEYIMIVIFVILGYIAVAIILKCNSVPFDF